MHVHIGVQQVAVTFASVLVAGFFWRVIATKYHDTAIGRAMAFIY